MERLILNPECHEIVINNGSLDGAIDLFSYGPESEYALRLLGSLYVVGHRATDSGNMGYIVSLIAALARREYFADPNITPRDAFAKMLKKVNEIVDDFFKSSSVDLSVGIFAVAGSSILVSKLDKFKILLAREGQTIDILNNVALFNKEHVERRRFSSIISGSIQPDDRILAYYPSKPVTTRERTLKSHLTKLATADLVTKLEDIGREHTSFATAMLCIDMVQSSEPAITPESQPEELRTPEPQVVSEPRSVPATYAWAPRQHAHQTTSQSITPELETEPEIPHIISTEFALGTRRTSLSKLMDRLRLVRLDTRGKAFFLGGAAVAVIASVLVAKSFLFTDPTQQKISQTIEAARSDLTTANTQLANDPNSARQLLMRALSAITAPDIAQEKSARTLTASVVDAMDQLDNAQPGTLTLFAQPDPKTDTVIDAVWASASDTLWALTHDNDNARYIGHLADSTLSARVGVSSGEPTMLFPIESGVVILDTTAHATTRILGTTTKTLPVTTQDNIIAGSMYEGSLYLLTDKSIIKVADLDTDKPVTKQWLSDTSALVANAARIYVDGSVWVFGRDGMLTEYYKGKQKHQLQTSITPSGNWELLAGPQVDQLAIANSDTKRIYIIDMSDGTLVRTIKIDTEQPIIHMLSGPTNSTLIVTKDNKIWSVK